ncbi:MAG: GerMN domain-containing protein [Oscillospiraceae bacterium]|nr:GerMN domain-containing protein [Oscillospiraceae bacterium]
MRRKICIAVCAALCLTLLLPACTQQKANSEETAQIYFAVSEPGAGGTAVGAEGHVLTADELEKPVDALLSLLLAGPAEESELVSPFPAGVTVRSWQLEEGQLTVDLSGQYGGLSGVDLTIANSCIALTLCQLDEIASVGVTVEGDALAFRQIQQMSPSDLILDWAEEEAVSVMVTLWFPRQDGDGLGVETRQVLVEEDGTLAQAAMEALLAGPTGEDLAPIPTDVQLLSVTPAEGGYTLNLSEKFLTAVPDGDKQFDAMVYCMTNTLCSLDTEKIKQVLFLVDGQPVDAVGDMLLSEPVTPDFTLEK